MTDAQWAMISSYFTVRPVGAVVTKICDTNPTVFDMVKKGCHWRAIFSLNKHLKQGLQNEKLG